MSSTIMSSSFWETLEPVPGRLVWLEPVPGRLVRLAAVPGRLVVVSGRLAVVPGRLAAVPGRLTETGSDDGTMFGRERPASTSAPNKKR